MMYFKIFILVIFTLFNTSISASSDIKIDKIYNNYDGDTFRAYFSDNKHEPVRIKGVDTPEINGKCEREIQAALRAKKYLGQRLNAAHSIVLVRPTRDRYNRVLATVLIDGVDIANDIIANGYGRKWRGKRESWCN